MWTLTFDEIKRWIGFSFKFSGVFDCSLWQFFVLVESQNWSRLKSIGNFSQLFHIANVIFTMQRRLAWRMRSTHRKTPPRPPPRWKCSLKCGKVLFTYISYGLNRAVQLRQDKKTPKTLTHPIFMFEMWQKRDLPNQCKRGLKYYSWSTFAVYELSIFFLCEMYQFWFIYSLYIIREIITAIK